MFKNENGMISVYVMGVMLFLLFVTIGIYNITSKKYKTQIETIEKTVEICGQNTI